jgi:hypothetical protein
VELSRTKTESVDRGPDSQAGQSGIFWVYPGLEGSFLPLDRLPKIMGRDALAGFVLS